MKRRKFILGTGAAAAGGATLLGSGAFSSVEADRDIAIDVVNDDDAYLRLAACTDEDGNEKPNGAYVYQGDDGLFSISLSEDNGNDPPAGSGVNPEALSKFYNVFEICNQGTQDVCLNFGVDSESDVPKIPDDADVPLRFDFGPGDPAVVFYEDDTEEPTFPVDGFGASDGITLEVGECRCFGFNVRAYGFDSGEDIFADTDLTIVADADAECKEEVPGPEPEETLSIEQDSLRLFNNEQAQGQSSLSFEIESNKQVDITAIGIDKVEGRDADKIESETDNFGEILRFDEALQNRSEVEPDEVDEILLDVEGGFEITEDNAQQLDEKPTIEEDSSIFVGLGPFRDGDDPTNIQPAESVNVRIEYDDEVFKTTLEP